MVIELHKNTLTAFSLSTESQQSSSNVVIQLSLTNILIYLDGNSNGLVRLTRQANNSSDGGGNSNRSGKRNILLSIISVYVVGKVG